MTVKVNDPAFVASTPETLSLSAMFAVSGSTGNPTYLVLNAIDRDEYAAGATGATGSFSGNGNTATFGNDGGDARTVGIVFTYQASTGRYYSSTYGYLDQLQYTASASLGDVTNISLFGTSSLSMADAEAANTDFLMQYDPGGYFGSATVVTQNGYSGPAPTQATPDSIAAAAESFVGKAWNLNGCWVLASTIAADAGTSLPVQSTAVGLPGQANGEWIVAFDGPAGQSGNWESMVKAGEMIVIGNATTAHITTCVSGAGSTAMLVDNITYENGSGTILNPANDGSSSDVTVSAPHPASQEWAGIATNDVVIYELDTPIITDAVANDNVTAKSIQALSSLFSAADPANKAITTYQIYDSDGAAFMVNGVDESAESAANPISVGSLTSIDYVAPAGAGTDTIDIRAYNGSYWDDWQTLGVTVAAPSPPTVTDQTAAQTWTEKQSISLVLPANTFTDPAGEALTFAASLSNGQPLPSWLSFNPATDSFSGTAPITAQTLGLKVTATDTSGLSVADVFQVSIVAPASSSPTPTPTPSPSPSTSPATPEVGPVLAHPTGSLKATDGVPFSYTLPANTFTDAASKSLNYLAVQIGGANVSSWLHFNAATETLFGTAPARASGTAQIEILATAPNGLSASETFNVSYAPAGSHAAASTAPHVFGAAWLRD